MPQVRHKVLKGVKIVFGSEYVQLDDDGVGEVSQSHYEDIESGRIAGWEIVTPTRRSFEDTEEENVEDIEDENLSEEVSKNTTAEIAISIIKKMNNVDELNRYVQDEVRTTVLSACREQIKKLT